MSNYRAPFSKWFSRLALLGGAITALWGTEALAQDGGFLPAPSVTTVDANGIDLISGQLQQPNPAISIGGSGSGISRKGVRFTDRQSDNFSVVFLYVPGVPNGISVITDGVRDDLYQTGTYAYANATTGTSATCTAAFQSGMGTCTYVSRNGTQYVFNAAYSGSDLVGTEALLTQIVKPDGEVLSYGYNTATDGFGNTLNRLQSVSSSLGWMVKYTVTPGDVKPTNALVLNTAIDYCNPTAETCSYSHGWENVSLQSEFADDNFIVFTQPGTYTRSIPVSDYAGNATTVTTNFGVTTGGNYGYLSTVVTSPTGVTKMVTYNGDQLSDDSEAYVWYQKAEHVTVGGSTWTYSFGTNVIGSTYREARVYNPNYVNGSNTNYILLSYDIGGAKPIVYFKQDELGRRTSYVYDDYTTTNGKIIRVIDPDATYSGSTVTGGYTDYGYDARGNVTLITAVPKAGSGLSNIVKSATYAATCTNAKTCDKPLTTTSADGVTTTYTYDSATGNVLTETMPAVAGVQAQTRYSYSQITPHIKDAGGNLVAQAPVWRLTGISSCKSMTLATCVGSTDEVKTTITYNTTNAQPITNTVSLGDGSLPQTTTYTYDDYGNVVVEDGPKPGTVDATYYFYDTLNRKIGMIGPDPDGAGSRQRPASRTTFDSEGRVATQETGTVAGTSYSDLLAMTPVEKDSNEFSNVTGLPVFAKNFAYESGSYVLKHVSQFSYDNRFRLDCEAIRLNPSVYGSLPSSACTLGTQGPDGTDKITKYYYDNASAVIRVTKGYGTASAADDFVKTYNAANGLLATNADGNGNLTTYEYDGLNRLVKTRYPMPSTGTVSSTTDYEQTTYTGAQISSVRLRDGQIVNFAYDALGRVSGKSGAISETIAYDNANRIVSHSKNGVTETYGFNALGWLLSDQQPTGTVNYVYDAYGKRSQTTYPGGFSVTYDYDDGDELAAIKENGATTLASYDYDPVGHRWHLYRANGQTTTYNYDSESRLLSVAQTGNTTSFSFNTATAQIKTRSNSSGSFDPATPATATISYGINGLNQISTVAGTTISYDARGNLTGDGGGTYTYNAENLLISATQSGVTSTLTYDAEDRLSSLAKSGVTTKFLYDGADLIAEYDGAGNLLRRYVHGEGESEPLVWYEGSGTGTKYYFHADDNDSIVSVTDGSGAVVDINRYDEYGLKTSSAPASAGRFAFTGQVWLPEIGLYYYRARLYNPAIGRFMQTDPLGYGDGLNWYAYVHDDPVNGSDPSGLCDPDKNPSQTPSDGMAPSQQPVLHKTCTEGIGNDHSEADDATVVVVKGHQTHSHHEWLTWDNALKVADVGADMFVPGYDLAKCAIYQNCSATDIALGIAGLIPADKLLVDGIKGGRLLMKAAKIGEKCVCLVAGTEVETPNGLVAIEKLDIGDLVLAYDEQAQKVVAKPVVALIRPAPQATFEVGLADAAHRIENFRASANHPWLLANGQWEHTQDLKPGEHIKTATGIDLIVTSLKATGRIEQTYNLTVADLHTYLVGANHAVVHNGSICKVFVKDFASKATKNWSAVFRNEREARNLARGKLGAGAVEVEANKWRSADGKWQYRAKPGDVAENHVHLEELNPKTGEVLQNLHLRW